jgi:hypothetical protein
MELADRLRRFLWNRQHNYKLTFKSPPGEEVLKDLARFCRATKSVYYPNNDLTQQAIGRHDVWLRISNHLHLTQDDLYRLVSEGE